MCLRKLKLMAIISACMGFAALMSSCEKDVESIVLETPQETHEVQSFEGVVVKDGVLHFASADAFFSVTEKLENMSFDERLEWEQSVGFVSLATEIDLVFEELACMDNDNAEQEICSRYSDLVILDGDFIRPIVSAPFYQLVSNREGYYFVGEVIHRVIGNALYTSEDGIKESLDKVSPFVYMSENNATKGCGLLATGYNGISSIYHFEQKTMSIPYGESGSQWANYTKVWNIGDEVQNVILSTPEFTRIKGEAKNAGLSVWATVKCGW